MKTLHYIFWGAHIFALSQLTFANEEPNGAALTKKYCAECHGETGNRSPEKAGIIPNIAGFSAILIFDTMSQFKEGDRKALKIKNKNGQLTNMQEISKSLSEQETEAISLYLSAQIFIPAKQHQTKGLSHKELISQGKTLHQDLCNDCHSKNGISAADDTPILAGQWKTYLIRQFEQISNRERYIPKRMRRKFRKLSDDDKVALIEFYSSR